MPVPSFNDSDNITVENIARKETTDDNHFLLFLQCFLSFLLKKVHILCQIYFVDFKPFGKDFTHY